MQAGRNAAASAKETAKDAAASAKAGMDKTKAATEGKVGRMTTRDPLEKELATERKDEKISKAELQKQEAHAQHAAEKASTRSSAGIGVGNHPAGLGDVPGDHHRATNAGTAASESVGLTTGTGTTAAARPYT